MRKGENDSKDVYLNLKKAYHRIIIPLYIPFEDEYYKQSYQIFEMCLDSIHKTTVNGVVISVICNACSKKVNERVFELFNERKIDECIVVHEGIGKVNALLKSLRTAEERLITITDADVLFLNGWEEEVIKVFENFPKAGVVSPVPIFRRHNNLTYNIWFDYLFSRKLRFTKVKNPEGLIRFANSIGWPWLDEKYKDIILTVSGKDNLRAVVGSPHFVATYKSEVFATLPSENSIFQLGGDSEVKYTDEPVIKCDGYRLATEDNYGYHLGNAIEDWMLEEYAKLKLEVKRELEPTLKDLKPSRVRYYVKSIIFRKLMTFQPLLIVFFKNKGVPKEKMKQFLNAKV
jgi:hypothetical protein